MSSDFPPRMSVVVGAIVQRDSEIAFVRNTYGPWRGVWTLPSGYVDSGEQPDNAAAREALEESGLTAEVEGLVSAVTLVHQGAPLLYLVFLARYISGKPTPDGIECDGARFFGLESLDGDPTAFDGQNAHLARLVLTGTAQVLRPITNPQWHPTYRTTYA